MNFLNHPIVLFILFMAVFYVGHKMDQKAYERGHSKGYKEGLSLGRLQVLEEDILRTNIGLKTNEKIKKLLDQTCFQKEI